MCIAKNNATHTTSIFFNVADRRRRAHNTKIDASRRSRQYYNFSFQCFSELKNTLNATFLVAMGFVHPPSTFDVFIFPFKHL